MTLQISKLQNLAVKNQDGAQKVIFLVVVVVVVIIIVVVDPHEEICSLLGLLASFNCLINEIFLLMQC